MGKVLGSLLWSFAFVVFFVWVFVSTNGSERITRACTPITWTGSVSTSLTSLLVPAWEMPVEKGFKKATYSCEFTLWRLFYEEAYLSQQKEARKAETDIGEGSLDRD